jgi:isoquinoline 1-oxidoreductase beta subunit
MNIITNPGKLRGIERRIQVEKISRRDVLRGLGIAGGLVLAAPVMSRQAFAKYQTGAGKMPHGTVVDPRVFVAIDRGAPCRNGNGCADQPADDRG